MFPTHSCQSLSPQFQFLQYLSYHLILIPSPSPTQTFFTPPLTNWYVLPQNIPTHNRLHTTDNLYSPPVLYCTSTTCPNPSPYPVEIFWSHHYQFKSILLPKISFIQYTTYTAENLLPPCFIFLSTNPTHSSPPL